MDIKPNHMNTDERKTIRHSNYMFLSRLLAFGGLALILLSRKMDEPQRTIMGDIGLGLIVVLVIVMILFYAKPGLFGSKMANPNK
jgi:uncharacterized membrane protein YidH (DUF202 family)